MANDETAAPARLRWMALLPWQRDAARAALAQRSNWPHALLIHGPRGIGKHALALNFAQGLLCEAPASDGLACGACPGCRYAQAGQHPDLLRLELLMLDPDDGSLEAVETISVDRIRSLTGFAQLTGHRQQAKVAVIAPAERMLPAAANALLKTLEEPPPGTYLILVSDHPGRVPATILSRCRKMAAPLPTPAEAQAWLAAQGVARPDLALALAGGAPLTAHANADPGVEAERSAWVTAVAQPARMSVSVLAARIDAGGKEQRKARLAQALEWLIGWSADLARVAAGDAARQNPDAAEALQRLSKQVAPIALFRYHRSLLRQRALLVHPLQPRLVAEALLIDYLELVRQ